MDKPKRRVLIQEVIKVYQISLKKACKICCISHSAYYYRRKGQGQGDIEKRLLELAREHIRWGFTKMFRAMKKDGCCWNHKKVYRIYCDLKLNLRRKPKKRLPSRNKEGLLQPLFANYYWSIDFMSDALMSGRKFRTLNVLDDYNREGLGIMVRVSLPAVVVTSFLEEIAFVRGYPLYIRVDNGPEFISKAFTEWANKRGIVIHNIQPGKPAQNAYIERFNRTYREDILDAYLVDSIQEVQEITDEWLIDYNTNRPHESLGNKSPVEFAASRKDMSFREAERLGAKPKHGPTI